MKNEVAKVWVILPKDVLRKLDRIAKRNARSRQKQMGLALAQFVEDSYLAGERQASK